MKSNNISSNIFMKFEPQFKKTSQMFSRKTLSVCGFAGLALAELS